ncbi:MAG: TetR-like C-terminal domain-containing protein, partial [Oscillospiraceae bacterium]
NSVNRDIYESYLMKMCEYVITTYLDTVIVDKKISEQDRKIFIRLIKCEFFGACIEWMNSGMVDDVMDDLNRLLELCRGIPEEILSRSIESNK